jgi:pimeloyl-ACP methyl ester carboxylesterase
MANDTSSEAISRRRLLKTGAAGLALTSAISTAPRYISVAHAEGEVRMAKVKANGITMNYAQQGTGEPLVLIPYLAADNACYAFQVADYAKHFTCISVDPRGAGETDKPEGTYSMELFADDIAAFMQAIGVERAHVSGLSLGAATGLWVAGKYPQRVKSLSLHSCWPKSDAFLKTVAGGWQSTATGLNSVTEMIIQGIIPWCFTPDFYSSNPEFMDKVAAFVRSRPKQPLDAFMRQSNAVIAHDAASQLARIKAPTQITFGRHDQVTSMRFADALTSGINGSELLVFETCAHAPIYQSTAEFNEKTLNFLKRHTG